MRVGIGYDIHALQKGRRLILGGVEIPFSKSLVGHFDGDALVHAIVDAILGAMGEGDIGEHFSDKDSRNKNANSLVFVEKAKALLKKNKFKILNIDSVVIAEAPKLSAYKLPMRKKIASVFNISLDSVSVKAKTNEGFGPLGKNQAIACTAVVALKNGRNS